MFVSKCVQTHNTPTCKTRIAFACVRVRLYVRLHLPRSHALVCIRMRTSEFVRRRFYLMHTASFGTHCSPFWGVRGGKRRGREGSDAMCASMLFKCDSSYVCLCLLVCAFAFAYVCVCDFSCTFFAIARAFMCEISSKCVRTQECLKHKHTLCLGTFRMYYTCTWYNSTYGSDHSRLLQVVKSDLLRCVVTVAEVSHHMLLNMVSEAVMKVW